MTKPALIDFFQTIRAQEKQLLGASSFETG